MTKSPTNPRLKTAKVTQTTATATPPAALSAAANLTAALGALPVTLSEGTDGIALRLVDDRQFASGSSQPALQTRALLTQVAEVLDKLPGAIVVVGHADALPPGARYASNEDLSLARAQSAVRLMAAKLANPKRLSSAGKGDTEPLAPNNTDADRAKNRRVTIVLKASPQ